MLAEREMEEAPSRGRKKTARKHVKASKSEYL